MEIYYNPLDPACKSVLGGVRQNESFTIRIFGKSDEPCIFVLRRDGCEAQSLHMQNISGGWELQLSFAEPGLYFYWFRLGGRRAALGEDRNAEFSDSASAYQILVYRECFATPAWFKGGIMYQIFPDRFFKSGETLAEKGKWLHRDWHETPEFRPNEKGKILNNDFFGGNFRGILKKLDYLQSLHVTVIYLNPIFRAFSNHRYDTGDYMQLDPMLGSEEDFSALVSECGKRGIRLILDGVFNHTGDDSRYFNKYGTYDEIGAYQSKDSKYYSWYNFRHFPDKYDSWWGIDVLPAVNENCPSYIDFITGENGVLRRWMKYPLGGFRLDVADELPDEFVAKIRSAVKSANGDAVVIGEVWEDASNKIAYSTRRKYFQGEELDSVMNYPLKDAIINFVVSGNTSLLRRTVGMLLDHYPKCVLDSLMNILGTHDTVRVLTALGGVCAYNKEEMAVLKLSAEQRAVATERLKIAAILLYTFFGVPCIYYGDEIGMEGYSDPFCRKPFAWDLIDEDILSHYRWLGELRSRYTAFRDGDYRELYHDDNCIVFERRKGKEAAITVANLGNNKYTLRFNGVLYNQLSGERCVDRVDIEPHHIAVYGNISII